MKIIIIEGTDNTGKNTVISKLLERYNIVKVIHCDKPKGKNFEECKMNQYTTFYHLAGSNVKDTNSDIDCIIHNRSWYGEYVYGCMYRENDPEFVIKMINNCEKRLLKKYKPEDIVYITLLSNNAEFLIKNDDGLSISNAKKDKIIEETKRFEEIYNYSILKNKKIIYVNNDDKFRSNEDIMNEIYNML